MFYLDDQERELKWNGEVLYRIKLELDPFDPESTDDIFISSHYCVHRANEDDGRSAALSPESYFDVEDILSEDYIEWMLTGICCVDHKEWGGGGYPPYDFDHYCGGEYPIAVLDYLLVYVDRMLSTLLHYPDYAVKELFPDTFFFIRALYDYELVWAKSGASNESWPDILEEELAQKNIPLDDFAIENIWLPFAIYLEFHQALEMIRNAVPDADRFSIGGP